MEALGGALARGRISLYHDSLMGSHCDSTVDKTLKYSSTERDEKTADTGTVRRNNYDATRTSSVSDAVAHVFWNDKISAHSRRYVLRSNREVSCHTLEENWAELAVLFMDHQHCLFIR